MKRNFKIKVNAQLGATIHAATCNVVVGLGPRQSTWEYTADSPELLLAAWDEDNDVAERGLPATKICPCAHGLKIAR